MPAHGDRWAAGRGDRVLRLTALTGLPEIHPGDDLPGMIAGLAATGGARPGDILCIAQKVVSKAEGRIVRLLEVTPGPAARALAEITGKTPELCELILGESARIVRQRGGTLICQTHHGFVCANAGIDSSNADAGTVILLPRDSDRSARRIAAAVGAAVGGRVGVVITDTHGRAFRRGLVNVALGVAGFDAVQDRRGETDRNGRDHHHGHARPQGGHAMAQQLGIAVHQGQGNAHDGAQQHGHNHGPDDHGRTVGQQPVTGDHGGQHIHEQVALTQGGILGDLFAQFSAIGGLRSRRGLGHRIRS